MMIPSILAPHLDFRELGVFGSVGNQRACFPSKGDATTRSQFCYLAIQVQYFESPVFVFLKRNARYLDLL